MVPLFIVWVLVRVRILFISSLGPDFIYLESGSGFYRCIPGPVRISDESGSRSRSGFYSLRVRILYWSGSRFYPFLSRVRVRNLSSKSGSMSVSSSGFYPFRVLVRILSSMSRFGSTSAFYQHPAWKLSWSCVDNLNKGQGSWRVKIGPITEIYAFLICCRIIYLMKKNVIFICFALKLCDTEADK